jgi:hypothetical protein
MVFNATFNYISVILWQSDLLVEESGVPWKTTTAGLEQLSPAEHIVQVDAPVEL